MFGNWRKKKNEKVIEYLNEQLSGEIILKEKLESDLNNDCKTYEEIVSKLREYYNSKNKDDIEAKRQVLKSKIIVLESLKFNITNTDIIKDISIFFTIFLAFISFYSNFIKEIIKNDIGSMVQVFVYIAGVFLIIILFVYIIDKVASYMRIYNRNVSIAINLHKSVIKDLLSEIEGDNKEEKNKTIKKLDEIEKIMEGTNREVETLIRVIGGSRK